MNSLRLPWSGKDWEKAKRLFVREGKAEGGVSPDLQPNFLGHSLIVTVLLIAIGSSFFGLRAFAEAKEKDWFGSIERKEVSALNPALNQQDPSVNRIKEQLDEVQDRMERHSDVMIYFYKQYFVCLSMSWGLSIVAAICATLVSRDGWKKANNGLITIFIVTSCFALVYRQTPEIFEQKLNLESNSDLYLKYVEIRDDILNYLVTGKVFMSREGEPEQFVEVPANEFIYQVDKELVLLNSIPLSFDATQILEVSDILKQLNTDGTSNDVENLDGASSPSFNLKVSPSPSPSVP